MEDNTLNDVTHLKNQLGLARNEINNLRQQLKSLTHAHRKQCEDIRQKLADWRCLECRSRQSESVAAAASSSNTDLSLKYIGVVHTQFPEKRATPRQPGICAELMGKVVLSNVVLTNPEHALDGLQEYSHMWILFHFHRNDSTHVRAKVAPPRLNGLRTGVFATRAPHRPCPIGLSLVKIDRIIDGTIYFSGVDMVDQTPVLDIKPYIPQYDNPAGLFTDTVSLPNDRNFEGAGGENLDDVGRVLDGDENGTVADVSANSNLEESFYSRSTSRIGEREAPDGEEDEDAPRTAVAAIPLADGGIRIPSWINEPHTSQLRVLFKDSVRAQLSQFAEPEEKIRAISNILREDPRSVYLRDRAGNNCYVFRIASLYVSCKFNDTDHTVTVFKLSEAAE